MRQSVNHSRHRQRGQVLPLMAISLAALMGFAALAVDAGYLRYEQRIEQTAADSAAIAGATQLAYSASGVTSAAQDDASKNGFTDNGSDVLVSVSNPAATGPYAGNPNAVEVTVKVKHPSFFASTFGIAHEWVTATAVGLLRPSTGPDCVYVLKDTSTTVINGGGVNAPTCGMVVNGALIVNGSSVDEQSIGVAGRITTNGAKFAEATPAPSLQAADPCPMISGCAYLQQNPPASSPCNYNNAVFNGSASVWLSPGVYCGTTIFNGVSHVNFNSGLYVFTGSVITNGVKDYNGSDVTLALTGTGSFTFNGSSVNLTAPTSGNYQGMLFYAPDASQVTLNGGPGGMGGVLYFPKASMTFNGASSDYYVLIASTLTQNGAISMSGPGSAGSYIREGVLVQ